MTLSFNSEKFNASVFNRGTGFYVVSSSIVKWDNRVYLDASDIFKWGNRVFTPESTSILKWLNRMFVSQDSIIKWLNRVFITDSDIFQWNNTCYTPVSSSIVKWNNRMFAPEGSWTAKWTEYTFLNAYSIFKWLNVSGISWPLTDYLSVKTIQDEYIFPDIIGGNISFKDGSIGEATLELAQFVPEDSRCTFYLKGDARMFDGISRRCTKEPDGVYKLTIQEYPEILKPENGKGGLYLVKNEWHDVELHNLVSSLKPTDNDNAIGLLYMARSAIHHSLFKEYDETNNIFKFEYTGTAYNITEVFEDSTLLTERANAAALETASGWYHDTANKILYLRCTDNVFPYYHVISVPNIWDFRVPIRIGNIDSDVYNPTATDIYTGVSGATIVPTNQPPAGGCYLCLTGTGTTGDVIITGTATDGSVTETIAVADFSSSNISHSTKRWLTISNLNVATWTSIAIGASGPAIAYWETANGDVPLTTLETLLTALELEYEPVYRNGYCYIDISDKIGSGSTSNPANHYVEEENIIALQEIDMADARNMINGVFFRGYGEGAGGIISGTHINMNRGGRFVLLDDSSVHSQALADGYVDKYLDDHYLPARSIKFSAPLFVGDAVDVRKLGDTAHISIPSEYLEQDLRVKEIAIKLKPLSQTLTFGDKLISYDDQIKAMRDASEKYRKHLQGEIEEFTWSWNENLISNANITNTFSITADALKVQKLELTCSTSLFRDDAMQGANGFGGGGGGDGGTGGGGGEAEPTYTGPGSSHNHTLVSGTVGGPSGTVDVAAEGHTHTYSGTTGECSEGTIVATSTHTHSIPGTTGGPSATTAVLNSGTTYVAPSRTLTTGCCTGVNCGSRFVTDVTLAGGNLTPSTSNVASDSHTHSSSGTSGGPSAGENVAERYHTHTFSGTTAGNDSKRTVSTYDHTHSLDALSLAAESSHTHLTIGTGETGTNPYVQMKEESEIPVDGNKDPLSNWRTAAPGTLITAANPYKDFLLPGSDPEMYLTVKLSGPGITDEVEIAGSPFVVKVEDSIGPVLINTIVKEAGEFTVKMGLANKTTPADQCQINFSMQVQGTIFVDTIVKE